MAIMASSSPDCDRMFGKVGKEKIFRLIDFWAWRKMTLSSAV
jgi:hypothetical protein